MNDVAKFPGLMRRGTKWYLRMRVPDDVADTIGKREIWKSLRTGDYRTARRRYLMERAEIERQFEAIRNGPPRLTDAAARRMVVDWFHVHDRLAVESTFNVHGPDSQEAIEVAEIDLAMAAGGADEEVMPSIQGLADEILVQNGWPVRHDEVPGLRLATRAADIDKASSAYWALCGYVRRAWVESERRRLARLAGGPASQAIDPMFGGATTNGGRGRPTGVVTLSELVDRFVADPTRDAGTKVDHGYQVVLRFLGEFVPVDTPAGDVTRQHCRDVVDLLRRMPANASKKSQFKDLRPLRAAAEAGRLGAPPMSTTTANGYISKMSALFRWACREGLVERNPAERLMLPKHTHQRDARHPFSIGQLNAVVQSDIYKEPRERWNHRQWVFLLGLFAGLRLNEACTLGVDDVVVRDGVPVIMVRPDEAGRKRLKSRAATRTVPVHPTLVEAGFLDFVDRQREAGHEVLFPALKADRRGYYSDGYQKWFSRHLDKVDARAPRTSFHSTRHNFRDQLREVEAPRDVVLALGGWAGNGGTDDVYGGGLRPGTLARWVQKFRYDGLDLSHVHRRELPVRIRRRVR